MLSDGNFILSTGIILLIVQQLPLFIQVTLYFKSMGLKLLFYCVFMSLSVKAIA